MTHQFHSNLAKPLKKLARAWEHLTELKGSVQEYVDRYPFITVTKRSDDRRKCKLLLRVVHDPPTHWGLLIGDCIQNVRSALDHTVYELSTLPQTGDKRQFLQYPMCDTEEKYASAISRGQLAGVPPAIVNIIKEKQPFVSNNPDAHCLSTLRDLSNWDKHREIQTAVITAVIDSFEIKKTDSGHRFEHAATGRVSGPYGAVDIDPSNRWMHVKDRVVLKEYEIISGDDVHIKPMLNVGVSFASDIQAAKNREAISTLNQIHTFTIDLISELALSE